MFRARWYILVLLLAWPMRNAAAEERFPPPDFRGGYELPTVQTNAGHDALWSVIDVGALLAALSIASYLAIRARSRSGLLLLSIAAVAYFGFYRKGCVCPVGSLQNVAMASFGSYALPWVVGAFFLLPLLFTLRYGRVFCASVCPLGAVQELVLWKPVQVPRWLESALGLLAWTYLGLAVLLAATGADFIICRYDPFVGLFRFSATPEMLLLAAVLLIASMFVGRIYCRFFCAYGVLMRWLSPLARHRVSISPTTCVDCRLCETSCPYGAIRYPTRRPVTAPSSRQRRRLVTFLALTPLLVGMGTALAYLAWPMMSRMHRDVRLAELVWTQQQQQSLPVSDEVLAFRNSGQQPTALFQQAAAIQGRFSIGTSVFGGFMGLAVGLKLVSHCLRRGSREYLADPGACLACARCFKSCPVELERLAGRTLAVGGAP